MSTSMYITYYDYSGFAIIEFKDNRFRVSVKNISMELNAEVPGIPMMKNDYLETYGLKNNEFRKGFLKNDVSIFEYNFEKMFLFKEVGSW